jgi:hypothetical protein
MLDRPLDEGGTWGAQPVISPFSEAKRNRAAFGLVTPITLILAVLAVPANQVARSAIQ